MDTQAVKSRKRTILGLSGAGGLSGGGGSFGGEGGPGASGARVKYGSGGLDLLIGGSGGGFGNFGDAGAGGGVWKLQLLEQIQHGL